MCHESKPHKTKEKIMAVVARDAWTGRKGRLTSDLTGDWDEDRRITECRCTSYNPPHFNFNPPKDELWEFFQSNFPEEARLIFDRWLES